MNKNSFLEKIKKQNKTYIIAEAGSNHMQNLRRAYKLIDIAARSGADAIKFQTYQADEIATKNNKYNKIKNKFKSYSSDLNTFYKKFELPQDFYEKIILYCKKKKILFLTSVFGLESFNFIKNKCPIIKISSFEFNYTELLSKIIQSKKPILISTGCSDQKDINNLKFFFKKRNFSDYSLMHCGSSYPLKLKDANLNYIKKLKKDFPNKIIGYSDHTLGISSCIAAASIGAKIIEKHFTISRKDGSPDSFFSLEETELTQMIKCIREVDVALGINKKIITKDIISMKKATRSYYATANYKKGTKIKPLMFKALRPHVQNSVQINNYFNFLNKRLKKKIDKNEVLKKEHIR